ncbi:hypothetical protein QS460_03960 [Liquorilactobacillus mali]|uniref:lipopolysaccharide biosynthesis protein n=1 Tax=Liquorilactobacillus mali TaxID=1618 RepID=UPI002657273D|nr:hypothetical protein [Liquorilactobacillus mali]MDN7145081.1 hypothetical protein [Liquorilactobacillus mali]
MKSDSLIKNFSYTFFSNGISLVISSLVVFVIPKIIGVQQYSYWQLYTFFMMYVGILHFGWIDGIYLKFGGKSFELLDRDLFQKEFLGILLLQLVEFIIVLVYADLHYMPSYRKEVFSGVAFGLVFTNLRMFFQYILQITTKVKEYAVVVSIDRICYLLFVVLVIVFGGKNFYLLMVCDLVARALSMCLSFYFCKSLIVHKIETSRLFLKNIWNDISVGYKLLIANFASTLIIGVIRYGIQDHFGITKFGRVSLMLSISSFIMTFISAVSLVLFPYLRRIAVNKMDTTFINIREIVTFLLISMQLLYYPLMLILPYWLPQYSQSFKYMTILFPMTVFDGKFEILSNTMMKTLRLEKNLLYFNIFSLFFSLLGTYILVVLDAKLIYFVYLILVSLALRSILSVVFVSKKLKVNSLADIVVELVMVAIFIVSNWVESSLLIQLVIFGIAYLIFATLSGRKIRKIYLNIKNK